jgi:hypothetical protein
MPTWCIVRGCSNSSRKPHCKHLSWHSFPTQDESLLSEWLSRVEKKDVNKNWKICSEHFDPKFIEKTLTGRRRLKKGAVPTIFKQQSGKRKGRNDDSHVTKQIKTTSEFVIGQDIVFTPDENQGSSSVLNKDQGINDASIEVEKLQGLRRVIKELKQARIKSQTQGLSTNENVLNVQTDAGTSTTLDRQDEVKSRLETQIVLPLQQTIYFDRVSRLKAENEQLRTALESERIDWKRKEHDLRVEWFRKENELKAQHEIALKENQKLKQSIEAETLRQKNLELQCNRECDRRIKAENNLEESYFVHKNLCKTPKLFYYYTGFSVEEFEIFLSFLGISACDNLSYQDAGQSFTVHEDKGQRLRGRPRAMKSRDQLFLTLCRIKLSFSEQDLAVRFHISQTQVSRICTALINRMQNRFKEGGIWQDGDKNNLCPGKDNVPDTLKAIFPKVKCVIEGMKNHLPKPKKSSLGSSAHLSMVVPI